MSRNAAPRDAAAAECRRVHDMGSSITGMDHAGTARRNRGVLVLIASGAIGFHLGYARFFDWQIPVESAQVLAGIVRYPEETPFYVHHLKLWTILHQVCAVFLRAGVSEIALSKLVSGVLGMVSLQALALFTFALSGRAVESSAAAVLFFVSGVTYAGAVYPIFLMGVPFTYGVVGLSLMVLIAALIGSGLHRTGAFLLGRAGLLEGRRATTHWGYTHLLPLVGARHENARVVEDGHIVTSGGVTSGLDFALTLIARLKGDVVAQAIQLAIEYDPAPPFAGGHPNRTPEAVTAGLRARVYDAAAARMETALRS